MNALLGVRHHHAAETRKLRATCEYRVIGLHIAPDKELNTGYDRGMAIIAVTIASVSAGLLAHDVMSTYSVPHAPC